MNPAERADRAPPVWSRRRRAGRSHGGPALVAGADEQDRPGTRGRGHGTRTGGPAPRLESEALRPRGMSWWRCLLLPRARATIQANTRRAPAPTTKGVSPTSTYTVRPSRRGTVARRASRLAEVAAAALGPPDPPPRCSRSASPATSTGPSPRPACGPPPVPGWEPGCPGRRPYWWARPAPGHRPARRRGPGRRRRPRRRSSRRATRWGCAGCRAGTGDAVERHVGEVEEVLEEAPSRHVLAEGHQMVFLVPAGDLSVGPPRHHLVDVVSGPTSCSAPARTVACSLRARALAAASSACALQHAFRARPPGRGAACSEALAASCRCTTSSVAMLTARVPARPPPWTSATRIDGSRPPAPAGATSPTPTTATTRAAIPTAACPARRASARNGRPADHGERAARQRRAASASSARPTPQRAATPVRSRLPPRRSVGASGEATWPRATSPSGKPPSGARSRAHSASITATGKPMATDDPVRSAPAPPQPWCTGRSPRSALSSRGWRTPGPTTVRRRTDRRRHPAEQDAGTNGLTGEQEGDASKAQPGQRPPAERRNGQAEEDAATETGRQPNPPSPLSPRLHWYVRVS